ncbi:hypothetical protein [Nonomuraea diastatica]|uniref:Uncharacterized protein n=1 Tax=Nonomuraea diastatica TaxID=1848329 RepID=A0A4V2YEH7_9ACTN|nr:hypothetical protein [Nonomuraea diastatica]TDD19366.1 hypothetical protein E1294_21060 [Nonomuraea diastatica]
MEAAGDLRGRFDHGKHLWASSVEGLDAVDDEQWPDRGVGVVGVEHDLHLGAREGQRDCRITFAPALGEAKGCHRPGPCALT